jgi:hypothetical protein
MPKYKITKEITAKVINTYSPCESEFDKFVKKHGWTTPLTQKDIDDAPESWLDWLHDKGFIDEVNKYDFQGLWEKCGNDKPDDGLWVKMDTYNEGYVLHMADSDGEHVSPTNMLTINVNRNRVNIYPMEAFDDPSGYLQQTTNCHAPIYIDDVPLDVLLAIARERKEAKDEE